MGETLPNKNDRDDLVEMRHPDPEAPVRLASFDQHRSLLFSVAYRMLGSVADAEDILQETFIRWQQAPEEEIRSPRAYLVTIASRLCINHLQSARVQREEYVGQWLPEPIVTDPANDPLSVIRVDESISMAFLVLLERLTPVERAVFLLREVFEYEYAEIAAILGQSEANCRQVFRRSRQHAIAMRPRFKVSAQKKSELLEKFLRATASGEVNQLIAALADDVVLYSDGGGKAVALPNLVHGSGSVARAILGSISKLVPRNLVRRMALVNGNPGVIAYQDGKPFSVLTVDGNAEHVKAVYIVTNPEKLSHLPRLPASHGPGAHG
jgi:RNA polymerase sigma-70 factor, ECF subfamily